MFLSTTKITWDDPPSRSAIDFWLLGTTPDLCYGVNKDEEIIFHFLPKFHKSTALRIGPSPLF